MVDTPDAVVEATRQDDLPVGGRERPVGERLPWPQPTGRSPGAGQRRRTPSGYVGWVLTAWTVVMVTGAVVLWVRLGDTAPAGGQVAGTSSARPPVTTVPSEQVSAPVSPSTGAPPTMRRYWVDTFADAEGFREPGAGEPAGVLRKGTHYVFCKVRGPRRERDNGAYNHWWLLTNLDEVYSGGGPRAYVSALYLTQWGNDEAKDNNGVEIPDCPS